MSDFQSLSDRLHSGEDISIDRLLIHRDSLERKDESALKMAERIEEIFHTKGIGEIAAAARVLQVAILSIRGKDGDPIYKQSCNTH